MCMKLMTLPDATAYLSEKAGVSLGANYVRNQIDRGGLPAVVVAGKRHVSQDALDRLLSKWQRKAA